MLFSFWFDFISIVVKVTKLKQEYHNPNQLFLIQILEKITIKIILHN